jgi:hypothetical protein
MGNGKQSFHLETMKRVRLEIRGAHACGVLVLAFCRNELPMRRSWQSALGTGEKNTVEGDWPREKMLLPEEIGDAVAYALSRPPGVVVENIDLLNLTGRL